MNKSPLIFHRPIRPYSAEKGRTGAVFLIKNLLAPACHKKEREEPVIRPLDRKSKQTRERWLGCGRSISDRTAPSARTHAHATYVMHTFFLEYVMHTLVSFPFSGGTKALNKSSSSRRKWCSVLTSATRPWIRASLFFSFLLDFLFLNIFTS